MGITRPAFQKLWAHCKISGETGLALSGILQNFSPKSKEMEEPIAAEAHYAALKHMYEAGAPINALIGHRIEVGPSQAVVTWDVDERFFHAGGSLHGSMYFKMLDDAAFFAASSLERGFFMLTATFQIQMFRPVTQGSLQAHGKVVVPGKMLVHASAELLDERGRLVAAGQGTFARSGWPLQTVQAYQAVAGV